MKFAEVYDIVYKHDDWKSYSIKYKGVHVESVIHNDDGTLTIACYNEDDKIGTKIKVRAESEDFEVIYNNPHQNYFYVYSKYNQETGGLLPPEILMESPSDTNVEWGWDILDRYEWINSKWVRDSEFNKFQSPPVKK